jgi:hypothetical protein
MKREIWKSDQPVLSNDLDRAQSSKEEAITDRFGDTFDYGIVPYSQMFSETSPLEITLSLSPFQFDLETGVAYDISGERIIVDDSSLIYNASGPTTTTDNGVGGTSLTPQTTGCKSVPLTSGVVNYIYITYLESIDPNVFTLREITNERLFIKGDDSYRVDVVTDVGPAVGDPNVFKPFTPSLCIGIVDTLQVLSLTARKFFTLKSNSLSVDVPTALNTLHSLGKTYIMGQNITFTDHISAIGTGIVSDVNPHGLSINDITGVFSGKTAEQHEKLFHESGISGDQTSITSGLFGRPEDSAGSPFIGPTYARDTFLIKKLLPSGIQNFNGNGSQQLFTLTGGLTFNPGSGNLRVFLNGVLQLSPSQYTEIGNNAVNFVTPPTLGLPISLVVDGEAVQINGTTITSSQIPEDYLVYFVDPSGVFLDNGVYTIYLDASVGAIRLAYNGSPTNKDYRVYGVTTGTFTNLTALPIVTVASNTNNFLLWQVTWDSSGYGLGNDNFILVEDQRIFGTIGSNSLSRDSATDTVTIGHNLFVTGSETIGGSLSVAGNALISNSNLTIIPLASSPAITVRDSTNTSDRIVLDETGLITANDLNIAQPQQFFASTTVSGGTTTFNIQLSNFYPTPPVGTTFKAITATYSAHVHTSAGSVSGINVVASQAPGGIFNGTNPATGVYLNPLIGDQIDFSLSVSGGGSASQTWTITAYK